MNPKMVGLMWIFVERELMSSHNHRYFIPVLSGHVSVTSTMMWPGEVSTKSSIDEILLLSSESCFDTTTLSSHMPPMHSRLSSLPYQVTSQTHGSRRGASYLDATLDSGCLPHSASISHPGPSPGGQGRSPCCECKWSANVGPARQAVGGRRVKP